MSRAVDQAAESIAQALERFMENTHEDISADDIDGLEDTISSTVESQLENYDIEGIIDNTLENYDIEGIIDNKLEHLDISEMVSKEVSVQINSWDIVASDINGLEAAIQKHLESPAFQEVLDKWVKQSILRLFTGALHTLYSPPPIAEPVNTPINT